MPKKDLLSNTSANDLNSILGYKLRRASSLAVAQLGDSLKSLGLTVTEVTILYQLSYAPNSTSSAIGRVLHIKSANMAPLIVRLIDKKLIRGVRADGRSQSLSLTSDGEACLEKVKKLVEKRESIMSEKLSSEELALFQDILDRVLESLLESR